MTDSADQFNATRAAGKLDGWPEIHEEIGAALASEPGVITIVNHLGIAACDLAFADLLLTRAEEQGVGTLLPR
jgi:ornithine cyclodeaminase/alanine dehydrogenase-like protein (mu-crystallin family)